MTRAPKAKNRHPLKSSPSRRIAISHSRVASEPVTDKLGPKSTPISTAAFTAGGQ